MPGTIDIPAPPQRILLIKPSSLGDVTHALPVLELLKQRWPAARVSWLVTPACAGLVRGHPLLEEVILFDRRRLGRAWFDWRAAGALFGFHRELRTRGFDLVIDLQGLFRSGWMCRRTRSPMRVGFSNARELAWLFYTHRVDVGSMQQHAVDRYLKLAAALGCESGPARVRFTFPPETEEARQIEPMLPRKPFAVLLPATNWATKRWPVERFAALVEPLRQRFGLESVVAGGADAVELAAAIPSTVNLAGRTSLPQLVALLRRADLVIANDSGPMHIAAALGKPLVTVFGPTNPLRTGPYNRPDCVVRQPIDCSPCYRRRCSHQSCLQLLEIAPVLAAAERQLAGKHSTDPALAARV